MAETLIATAPGRKSVVIISDIHYAGAAERARGRDYEFRAIANPLLRAFVRLYRRITTGCATRWNKAGSWTAF